MVPVFQQSPKSRDFGDSFLSSRLRDSPGPGHQVRPISLKSQCLRVRIRPKPRFFSLRTRLQTQPQSPQCLLANPDRGGSGIDQPRLWLYVLTGAAVDPERERGRMRPRSPIITGPAQIALRWVGPHSPNGAFACVSLGFGPPPIRNNSPIVGHGPHLHSRDGPSMARDRRGCASPITPDPAHRKGYSPQSSESDRIGCCQCA
jgi:hypothetical protein